MRRGSGDASHCAMPACPEAPVPAAVWRERWARELAKFVEQDAQAASLAEASAAVLSKAAVAALHATEFNVF